eukprot:TRINITY_DN5245_c0_g1_i1.p1 TRINITY_DN5245_c0_g1~~TRINITY_DN5245_c0_g1_i1.p1  ORF type:complete len:673 (+),score=96.92 TRINITY_DN5245_c0_g1_i1:230-2248(+)
MPLPLATTTLPGSSFCTGDRSSSWTSLEVSARKSRAKNFQHSTPEAPRQVQGRAPCASHREDSTPLNPFSRSSQKAETHPVYATPRLLRNSPRSRTTIPSVLSPPSQTGVTSTVESLTPQPDMATPKVLIVGGGLAGALMSILLARRGYAITLVDSVQDFPELSEDRTFAVVLTARAIRALEHAGLTVPPEVGVTMEGSSFRLGERKMFTPYKEGERAITVGRNEFARYLLEVAKEYVPSKGAQKTQGHGNVVQHENGSTNASDGLAGNGAGLSKGTHEEATWTAGSVNIKFGWTLSSLEDDGKRAKFVRTNGEKGEGGKGLVGEGERDEETMSLDNYDLLIGADGVRSKVREELVRFDVEKKLPEKERFSFTQVRQKKSWKRFPVLPDEHRRACYLAEHPSSVQVAASRSTGVTIILAPTPKAAILGVIISPETEKFRFDTHFASAETVEALFKSDFPEIGQVYKSAYPDFMERLAKDPVIRGGTSTRCTRMHQLPRREEGGKTVQAVLLIGDAAHSVYPTLGQGANAALEDCRVLDEILEAHSEIFSQDPDEKSAALGRALLAYESVRKAEVDAIVDLSEDPPVMGLGETPLGRALTLARVLTLSLAAKVFPSLKPKPLGLQADIPYTTAKQQVEREETVAFGIILLSVGLVSLGALQVAHGLASVAART